MPVVNPQHLLEQAASLSRTPGRKPRQADLRRSISSAYYAVFHFILIAASNELIGTTVRNDPRYALVYRSIDHRDVRSLCEETIRKTPSSKFSNILSANGFDDAIRQFANFTLALQVKRHDADYNPSLYLTSVDSLLAVNEAQTAIDAFERASPDDRKLFLTLLLFPPR